jgi:serine/threonine protein kinase/tetratricopeptide (TPR) repeat protein
MAAPSDMVGRVLGHYRILEQIGAGGMGVVYRAHDEQLDRDVALKVLLPGTLANESARRQFRRGALALAKLNHPNVAIVYEFDSQDGLDFLVMELISGLTLDAKLAGRPLLETEILRLGVQLADALQTAHTQGIVHRDLKPGNLCVTSDDRLKVLDFGLAQWVQQEPDLAVTATANLSNEIRGTVPYMAPEQLRGNKADARSDIYSSGAVLYEMATGRCPFTESGPQLVGAILEKPPSPPTASNHSVSVALQSIILKALEKDPNRRYQSAKELRVDLERLSTGVAPVVRDTGPAWPWISLTAFAVIVAVFFAFDVAGWRDRLLSRTPRSGIKSLVVLPLENLSGDPEQGYFADGMTDELTTKLAQVGALRVISRTSATRYKHSRKALPEIAKELHVDAVVEGSVMRSGDKVRISAQLIEASTDKHLWARDYEQPLNDVLHLQNLVAQAIVNEVKIQLSPQEQARLASSRLVNSEAHEAYLKGRYHLYQRTEENFREARVYFEEAANIDRNYASAYAGLADYYWLTDELSPRVAMPKAKNYVLKALAIDDALADAHSTLADIKFYGDWDWLGADKEFKRAIELKPSYAEARTAYSAFLSEMGRDDQAVSEIRTAQQLDPLSPMTASTAAWAFYYARQYDLATEQALNALALEPESLSAHDCLGSSYLAKGLTEKALAEYRIIVSNSAGDPLRLASLARAYAVAGRRAEARQVAAQLVEASRVHYVPPFFLALIYATLNSKDQAFSWLEKAYQEHDSYLVRLKVEPGLDPLRSDPRFEDLLLRMKFLS